MLYISVSISFGQIFSHYVHPIAWTRVTGSRTRKSGIKTSKLWKKSEDPKDQQTLEHHNASILHTFHEKSVFLHPLGAEAVASKIFKGTEL